MAKKRAAEAKSTKKPSPGFVFLRTLCGVTVLLACLVLAIGGVRGGVRTNAIIYNCLLASAGIGIVFWFALRAVSSYEEIDGGQA